MVGIYSVVKIHNFSFTNTYPTFAPAWKKTPTTHLPPLAKKPFLRKRAASSLAMPSRCAMKRRLKLY